MSRAHFGGVGHVVDIRPSQVLSTVASFSNLPMFFLQRNQRTTFWPFKCGNKILKHLSANTLLTLSCSRTSEFSPRNLMSHVRAAVVMSCPAPRRVRTLSFICLSVSLSSLGLPSDPFVCFIIRDSRKSSWKTFPLLLIDITQSSMPYILSRAWNVKCSKPIHIQMVISFKHISIGRSSEWEKPCLYAMMKCCSWYLKW